MTVKHAKIDQESVSTEDSRKTALFFLLPLNIYKEMLVSNKKKKSPAALLPSGILFCLYSLFTEKIIRRTFSFHY
ncbi:hypothetical protein DWW90_11960 [Parabacteroides sp. AF17-28]|nr:hypothetical protein DWW90_11960 [Parabacteroides sp. AF17-28]